jgi:osmoprotectant transport system substrate-binding protein
VAADVGERLPDDAVRGPVHLAGNRPLLPGLFCQPGLQTTYGITFGSFLQADVGGPQTKTALKTGNATLGLVFSSDSSLTPA